MPVGIVGFFMYLAMILAFALIGVKITFSSLLLKEYYENREAKLLIPVAGLFFMLAVSRSILIYFDFFVTGLNDDLFQQYSIIWKISMIFLSIGYAFFIYVSEKEIFIDKTKNIITILSIIILFVIFLVPNFDIFQTLLTLFLCLVTLFFPIGYVYIAKKSTGKTRKKAISVVVGFFTYMFCMIMLSAPLIEQLATILGMDVLLLTLIMYSISMVIRMIALMLVKYGYSKI